jgi:FkbM family methyltransferase
MTLKQPIQKTLTWLVRLAKAGLRLRRTGYVALTPHFFSIQRILGLHDNRIRRFRIRHATDYAVLEQIFLREDYSIAELVRAPELRAIYDRAASAGKPPLIIDCGANIGVSAAYFGEMYPAALIVAIEPDAGNVALARQNAVSERIDIRQVAVGSNTTGARLVDPGLGSTGYRVLADPTGDLRMISIGELLAEAKYADCVPFLIKIDIEGAEEELFSANCEWLDRFPLLVIELHDWMLPARATSRPFLREVAALDRDFVHIGDNVFSISNTLVPAPDPSRRRRR